jgi:hypothetical protein
MERRQIKSITQSLINIKSLKCRYCVGPVKSTCPLTDKQKKEHMSQAKARCVMHKLLILARELEVINEIEIE